MRPRLFFFVFFFFFNDTATTEIYTLSLHDALPISGYLRRHRRGFDLAPVGQLQERLHRQADQGGRSEEHTSELQSQFHLVCRLLLEKKKRKSADELAVSDHEELAKG